VLRTPVPMRREKAEHSFSSGWNAAHTAAVAFAVLVAACVGFGLRLGSKYGDVATHEDTGALEVRATRVEEKQAATDKALDSFRTEQRVVNAEMLRYLFEIKRSVSK
jgi:hypothetical protein